MATLIGSASLWYSSIHSRWLTPRELLVCQGFPLRPHWSFNVACCSFSARMSEGLTETKQWPSRASIAKMSGNSMHCNVSGVIFLHCLTQTVLDKHLVRILVRSSRSKIPQQITLKRKRSESDAGCRGHAASSTSSRTSADPMTFFLED